MKRLAYFLLIVGVCWLWWRSRQSTIQLTAPAPAPTPSPAPSTRPPFGLVQDEDQFVALQVGESRFRVAWTEVKQPRNIIVGVNASLATSSASLQDSLGCLLLTNATFYDKTGSPMGLLRSDTIELVPWKKNQLFNGVIGFDSQEKRVVMEQGEPTKNYLWAIQAGPILWNEGLPVVSERESDQPARRIVMIITDHSELFIGVVTAEDSLFGGPTLQQMQGILTVWQQQSGKQFKAVLNLDGGTASAYLSPTLKLKELKPIGSFVCVK